ncbi:hypothetical protein JV173_00615 [Acholeplasma equirhinis]|uniref:hypothetical protein n=1 Tax=Acholeplasma equirhinis TaxID=555393 RepID=UPI00197AD609|nr:hypothetical protein [Acholeplasma equirhinis]MBN3490006.1 hypothetical protein [Acholeplasma equirhinis]
MKGLTTKFALSVLSLVLTGVALSVGVYAWFTINNTASVDQFQAEVQTGEGFYVSTNGTAWKNTITNADLAAALSSVTFEAITTTNGYTMEKLDGAPASATSFIKFDLFFVGSTTLSDITLTSISIASPAATSWIPGQAVAGTRSASDANAVITEYASNAARVSIIDLGDVATVTIFEQEDGVDGNSLGMGAWGNNEAVLFYNAINTTGIISQGVFEAAEALYPTTIETTNVPVDVATLYEQEDAAWFEDLTVGSAITGTIGEDFKVGKISVRVWVEGWDQEAFNAILSGTIQVSLSFAGTV